jgi:ribosomal protein L35
MTNNKGTKKRFKCILCKQVIWTEKEYLRHLLSHFNNERCPICNMKAKHKALHLAEYHVHPNKLLVLERDLAILVKESGNYDILYDPQFALTDQERRTIKKLIKEL